MHACTHGEHTSDILRMAPGIALRCPHHGGMGVTRTHGPSYFLSMAYDSEIIMCGRGPDGPTHLMA